MEQKKNIQKKPQKPKESFLKRNWHIILITVLLAFGMSQCAKSCNRKTNIKQQNQEILLKDSTINALSQKIDTLSNSLHYYTALYENETKHNTNFASIATGNQAELYSKINSLESKVSELEKTVSRLNKENKSLKDSLNKTK